VADDHEIAAADHAQAVANHAVATQQTRATWKTVVGMGVVAGLAFGTGLFVSGQHASTPLVIQTAGTRDPLAQPFTSTSIWNQPIGTSATYSATGVVKPPTLKTLTADAATLIQDPSAPLTAIKQNGGQSSNTCTVTGGTLTSDPIPGSMVVAASHTNSGYAVLKADGQTIQEGGAFARCVANTPATANRAVTYGTVFGDGLTGGSGGSGLSILGGTLRPGEIAPGSNGAPHALRVNIDCANDCTPTSPGFRWPATKKDSYAYSPGGTTQALSMGALLAIPQTLDLSTLGLSPAALELAWTLQNYGAYVVNDSARSVLTLGVEQGDANTAAQFQADWGFPLATAGVGGAGWGSSVQTIISKLAVVTNNGPTSIGGGGAPLQPLAPPLATGCVDTTPSPTAVPTLDADGDIDASPTASATPGPTPCPTGSPTASPTGTPTASPTPTPSASPSSSPPPVSGTPHVLVIMEENRGYAATLGSCGSDPYFCSLAAKYASFTNSHGVSHPSLPNYLAFDSGSTQGQTTDCTTCGPFSAADMGGQLTAKGITWKAWMESMPSACYTGGSSGEYAKKHNPFVYFADVLNNACAAHDVPYPGSSAALSALDGTSAPDFVFVTPNLLDDAHDGTVQQMDTWLSANLAPILASAWYLDFPSTVIVTQDEGNAGTTNQIATVVISNVSAGKGNVTTLISHYAVLRAIETEYGLAYLSAAAGAPDISSFFG
jgi:hypothetical protein